MTLAYWCVLAAGLLPYVAIGIAKWDRTYDNRDPRTWAEKLDGRKKRAHNAHLNAFEAFPLFAAGVIIAHLAHAPQPIVDALAMVFIAARLVYLWMYVANKAYLRSLAWVVGLGASLALFFIAAATRA